MTKEEKRQRFLERQREASKGSKPYPATPKRQRKREPCIYNETEADLMPDSFDPPDEPTW